MIVNYKLIFVTKDLIKLFLTIISNIFNKKILSNSDFPKKSKTFKKQNYVFGPMTSNIALIGIFVKLVINAE